MPGKKVRRKTTEERHRDRAAGKSTRENILENRKIDARGVPPPVTQEEVKDAHYMRKKFGEKLHDSYDVVHESRKRRGGYHFGERKPPATKGPGGFKR